MAERATHKCHECKEVFLTPSMVVEVSPSGQKTWYCVKCHNEKVDRMNFANTVCKIFGLKAPGPQIWTERKRLREKYGYTDNTIVDCLEYIYNVEHKKVLAESLCLVTPVTVNKMMNWKRINANKGTLIAAAAQQVKEEKIIEIKENDEVIKEDYNPDDWLEGM